MWTSGEKIELRRPYNDFSKTNWGDSSLVREGKMVSILTTTNLLNIINKLKEKQWNKILEAAIEVSKSGRKADNVQDSTAAAAAATAEQPVFELIDDDSDLD